MDEMSIDALVVLADSGIGDIRRRQRARALRGLRPRGRRGRGQRARDGETSRPFGYFFGGIFGLPFMLFCLRLLRIRF